jgi:CheY-like chemotaxis protein
MKKIIIAESVLTSLGSNDSFFKRGNVATYTARTSEEILNIQGVRKADVIITDATLPLMGAARLCAEIRKDDNLKKVSIIVVQSNSAESRAQTRAAQANAVIESPIDPAQLFSRISELITIPQRQDIRALLHVSVRGGEPGDTFLGITKNISISGMLIETDREMQLGEQMTCAIAISGRQIVADCTIMRKDIPSEGVFRYGVRFSNLDTKSFVIIDQFVKGSIKH